MVGDEEKYTSDALDGPSLPERADGDLKQAQIESEGGMLLTATRTKNTRHHWKRFWVWYLVGAIFLAVFLPVFFLVVIPAVAQLVINKSDLVLVNAVVAQPRPESVLLTLQAKIDLKIILPVRIEPVILSLFERNYGVNDAYGTASIPGQTIKGNYTLGVSDQFTPILNMTAWETFVRQVVFQEETTLSLKGVTNGYLGVLKCHVTMNKDVVTPTLNRFFGFFISDSTLILPAEPDGTNLIGNATLPNPTVLTLEVGTLVLNIKSGDLVIGNATLTDVELKPGSNTFPLRGVLDPRTVLKNLPEILKTQGPALKNGNLSLNAVASSINWQGTFVPYYTDVLRQLTLTADISAGDILKNTFHHLGQNAGLTAALSNISGNNASSGGSLVSRGDSNNRDMAVLAASLKQNKHVQDIFRDENWAQRDTMIDSLVDFYATL